MQGMIEGLSSNKLAGALESNMIGFYSAYGRGKGCTLVSTSSIVWFYTGIQDSLFNGVLSARLKPEDIKPTIDTLQSKIDEQGTPALWWVGPESNPDDLGSLLEGLGLKFEGEVPGMAIDLGVLGGKPETPRNFTIRKVDNPEMQTLWARIAAVGNSFPQVTADALVRLESTLSDLEYSAQHRYIGFLDDTPVTTSCLILDSGMAGIYAVATIPEARRKGLGRIMTIVPLLEARQKGYKVGCLQASSMGYPIYKHIGFKDICKFRLYLQAAKAL